jgi:hypothetical protein
VTWLFSLHHIIPHAFPNLVDACAPTWWKKSNFLKQILRVQYLVASIMTTLYHLSQKKNTLFPTIYFYDSFPSFLSYTVSSSLFYLPHISTQCFKHQVWIRSLLYDWHLLPTIDVNHCYFQLFFCLKFCISIQRN